MENTLAIIAAAGIGRRMGDIRIPKVMLIDKDGQHFIDDALTFRKYEKEGLDFAVMSRREDYHPKISFKVLNNYLYHAGFSKERILFQKTPPMTLVAAFVLEYALNRKFNAMISHYDNVLLLPGDHNLTADMLNLDDLLNNHERYCADVTMVFSKGWQKDSSKKNTINLYDNSNRIAYIKEVNHLSFRDTDYIKASSVGVWVIRRGILTPKILIPGLKFILSNEVSSTGINIQAYFIQDNWQGGRDTPDYIGK